MDMDVKRMFGLPFNPAQLDWQSHNLVQKYRNTTDTKEREEMQINLQETVLKQFDLLQKAREAELAKLKKELDRLQALHDHRQDQKDRIVGDRVRSLLREADGLGWGATSSSSRRSSAIAGRSALSAATFELEVPAVAPLAQPRVPVPTPSYTPPSANYPST